MKDSFVLQTKYRKQISRLGMEQRGVLFTAILCYEAGENLPAMDAATEMAFDFVREDLDENRRKYEEQCRKNAENGLKGGRPKKANETEKTDRFSENRPQPKKADNDNDNDSDSDNDSDNDSDVNIERAKSSRKEKVKKEIGPYISPSGPVRGTTSLDDLNEVYLTYLQSRKENKKPLKSETSIRANADKLIRMATANGALDTDKAAAILRQSIENGWQGLFELKEPMEAARSGTSSGYSGYSFDELEARLGGWA